MTEQTILGPAALTHLISEPEDKAETLKYLKLLWQRGLSADAVGRTLPEYGRPYLTQNAVIGRLHRAGIKRTNAPIANAGQQKRKAVRKAVSAAKRALAAPRMPALEPEEVTEVAEVILPIENPPKMSFDLKLNHCRWPYEDPGTPEFHFCGRSRTDDKRGNKLPYCAGHCRVAYTRKT